MTFPVGTALRSRPVDSFRLAYDRTGTGRPVVLLHGWPGDRRDYDEVVARLHGSADLVVPDLRGFGESDKHRPDVPEHYSSDAQARSIADLIEELGLRRPVVAGYDVGSRVAQTLAQRRPELVGPIVVTPPVPGVGERILSAGAVDEFWYQGFHRSALPEDVLDGRPDAIRAYLAYFWARWSGRDYAIPAWHLDRLVAEYAEPGALAASIAYYRAGSGTVATSLAETAPDPDQRTATPTTVVWPDDDVLFPVDWSDRLGEFFADVRLVHAPSSGHFVPLEQPNVLAHAIREAATSSVRADRPPALQRPSRRWAPTT